MNRSRKPDAFARAALGIVCALLLLAQQLGLSHAVWHAAQTLPHDVRVVQKSSGEAPQLPHASKLCPLDAALGQVLGAGPVSAFALHAASAETLAPTCAPAVLASLPGPSPRSRGPPAFL
jgi:hypothetical protein